VSGLCGNNAKQIGLALFNYEAAHRLLPPGAGTVLVPERNWTTAYGICWRTTVLPYVEEVNTYDRLDITSVSAGDMDYGSRNIPFFADFAPQMFVCPSSSLPKFSLLGTSKVNVLLANYVGIAGADGNDPDRRFNGDNVTAFNGVLFAHSKVSLAEITDGTSKTMMVGEQSVDCLAIDYLGDHHRPDVRVPQGWTRTRKGLGDGVAQWQAAHGWSDYVLSRTRTVSVRHDRERWHLCPLNQTARRWCFDRNTQGRHITSNGRQNSGVHDRGKGRPTQPFPNHCSSICSVPRDERYYARRSPRGK
jgi:hypothetical protein